MNLFQSPTAFVTSQRNHLTRLLLMLLLLAALPVFIWAVLTQRIELRKRAATAEPTQICWNRVTSQSGTTTDVQTFYWPNSCKGSPRLDLTCTQILIPLTSDEITQYQGWAAAGRPFIPGCGMPKPTSTCLPPPICKGNICSGRTLLPDQTYCQPGCYYQQVECIKAPCNPILVCPTPSCVPLPTCYSEGIVLQDGSRSFCNFQPAQGVTYCPRPTPTTACGPNGSSCVYSNCPPYNCPTGQVCPLLGRYCPTQTGVCQNGKCIPNTTPTPTPGPNCRYIQVQCIQAPCPAQLVCNTPTPTTSGLPTPTPSRSPTPTPTPSHSPTPTPTPGHTQTVVFLIKLSGVTGGQAGGAKIGVKFNKSDGTTVQLSQSLTLSHLGNGVYQASAVLTNPLTAGTQFSVTVKGEKHAAVKFTHQSGQTNECADSSSIVMPSGAPNSTFDFTGVPLPAGDTSPQDGQVNQTDIDRIITLMGKSSGSLTTNDKLVGDLNYDGVINVNDLFQIYKTLGTRCDAN